jgi:hypothetical protein
MPNEATLPRAWTCHWAYVHSLSRRGRPIRTRVWICEYPYRTMRAAGPCSDCEHCKLARDVQMEGPASADLSKAG